MLKSILTLTFFLSVALSARAGEISKDVILSKLSSGTLALEREPIAYFIEGMSKEALGEWGNRQKLVNPKFQIDLLYYFYTYDTENNYKIQYEYVQKKCLYAVRPRQDDENERLCFESYNECVKKLPKESSRDDVAKCAQTSPCQKMSRNPMHPEEIDVKYCEKAYGRKL